MTNVDLIQLTQQTKKLTAMIVEDEKVTNELLSSTLRNFFSEVRSFLSAKDALESYKDFTPDVIFADIMMGDMSGLELSRELRKINPNQIIVIISASSDMDKISESIEIGVNSFVQKPLDTKKILELLNTVIGIVEKKKKIETKTFSISLPLDLYESVDENAKSESISKNAVIIRALRGFYNQ
ncbi:MAG: response regulator [Sulfuricurvum sp.]